MASDPLRITVVGSGYVGTTLAASLADAGHRVRVIDIDESVVETITAGETPIHEPGLDDLVARNAGDRLTATTGYDDLAESDLTFLCIQTPAREDGSIDVGPLTTAAEMTGEALADLPGDRRHAVTIKSTVAPPHVDAVRDAVLDAAPDDVRDRVSVATNPEFLREGTAVDDFHDPDKLVYGTTDDWARDRLAAAYAPVVDDDVPEVDADPRTAMMIKYANNAFLASKISLINDLGNVCKEFGIDAYEVADAIGLDDRIGEQFLRSGVGWGGSCLTEDQRLLIKTNDGAVLTTIGEFFDRYGFDSSLEGISVLSCDSGGTFEFKPILQATRREYSGDLYTIETKMNKTVTVTEDHPMVTVGDGDLKIKQAHELSRGAELPVQTAIPENPTGSFDLIELLTGTHTFDTGRVYLEPSVALSDVEETLRSALEDYNDEFGYDRVREFVRNNYLSLDAFLEAEPDLPIDRCDVSLYTTRGGGQTYVPAILPADAEFWRFIGYYLSEGHISEDNSGNGSTTRQRIMLSFHPSEEQSYVDDVEAYLDSLGIRYREQTQKTATQIEVSSRVLAYFLRWLGCGTGSYTARIPDAAYDEPDTHRKALLAGLFRGDGHVEYTSHSNAVVYDYGSVSEDLIQGMMFLLHSLGIVPSYKSSQSSKSTQPAHFLRVSSKAQIEQLQDLFLDEKRERIQQRLDQYDRDIAPTGHTIGESFTSVKITGIKAEKVETTVYSLEVEDNHTFVTSDCLLVHNCFPKDTKAIVAAAENAGYEPPLLQAAVEVNDRQPERLLSLVDHHVDVAGKRVAVLGLSFKPGTDDTRNSRAVPVIEGLTARGGEVVAYDPVAVADMRERYPDLAFEAADSAADALSGAHAAVVVTDWDEFAALDEEFDAMADPVVVDGRRIVERRDGITYEGLTW